MIVIGDASVLIHLAAIGQLDLLRAKFGKIIVPKAVWREVVLEGEGKPGASEVEHASWIRVEGVKNEPLVMSLVQYLDDGEAEVIALALEKNADLVLLDEKDARETAEALGLGILGVIGILIWAKREQLIPSLKNEIIRLRQAAGFRVSQKLYQSALAAVAEDS